MGEMSILEMATYGVIECLIYFPFAYWLGEGKLLPENAVKKLTIASILQLITVYLVKKYTTNLTLAIFAVITCFTFCLGYIFKLNFRKALTASLLVSLCVLTAEVLSTPIAASAFTYLKQNGFTLYRFILVIPTKFIEVVIFYWLYKKKFTLADHYMFKNHVEDTDPLAIKALKIFIVGLMSSVLILVNVAQIIIYLKMANVKVEPILSSIFTMLIAVVLHMIASLSGFRRAVDYESVSSALRIYIDLTNIWKERFENVNKEKNARIDSVSRDEDVSGFGRIDTK